MRKKHTASFLDEETNCIFCGKTFRIKEVLYVLKTDDMHIKPDEVYRAFMENYFHRQEIKDRRYLICRSWNDYAIRKRWKRLERIENLEFVEADDIFGINGTCETDKEIECIEPKKPVVRIGTSVEILCPFCHCCLPADFYRFNIIRVGLFGEHHGGKSSFLLSNAIPRRVPGAVAVNVVTESDNVYKRLLEKVRNPEGMSSTPEGKAFPLALQLFPEKYEKKEPFFLVLQDIPGEYTQIDRIHHLASDKTFLEQKAFLAIVDINMFVRTEHRKELDNVEAEIDELNDKLNIVEMGETEKVVLEEKRRELIYRSETIKEKLCIEPFGKMYSDFSFAEYCKNLKSVQIVFTKIDQWVDAAERELRDYLKIGIAQHHDEFHDWDKNRINPRTLRNTSDNVKRVLRRQDVTPPVQDPMGHILELFKQHGIAINNNAYCAVACPPGAGMEGDSMNVLEPILNICVWEGLLPVKSEKRHY